MQHVAVCHSYIFSGMVAEESMTASAYQDLIDWGWRRSGTFLYKVQAHALSLDMTDNAHAGPVGPGTMLTCPLPMQPLMPDSCCCLHTIRLDATRFQPTKAQRKLQRTLEGLLAGQRKGGENDVAISDTDCRLLPPP